MWTWGRRCGGVDRSRLVWRPQDSKDGCLERRQVRLNGLPYQRQLNSFVLVSQPVPHASYVPPRQTGTTYFGIVAQANGCLADDLYLAFHRCNCFRIFAEFFEIHTGSERLDHANRVRNVSQRFACVSKRQAPPRGLPDREPDPLGLWPESAQRERQECRRGDSQGLPYRAGKTASQDRILQPSRHQIPATHHRVRPIRKAITARFRLPSTPVHIREV